MTHYFVIPRDPSSAFLEEIVSNFTRADRRAHFERIDVEPSIESYEDARRRISGIKDGLIIFLGHGIKSALLGGHSTTFPRQYLIKKEDIGLLKNKNILLVSCNSSTLLEKTRVDRNHAPAIGFSMLPSNMDESEEARKLKDFCSPKSIESYKASLVKVISMALERHYSEDYTTEQLYDFLRILISREIFLKATSDKDPDTVNLLFYLRSDMAYWT